jgi:zinc/manganese transport system permease protein
MVSFDQESARSKGISVPLWDFLFYMSLAWVVTSSVHVAGVLLIFSFLIVPAVCGLLLSRNFRPGLLAGWSVGIGVSLVGSAVSYWWDFPTGAAIVCTFGVTLLFVGLVKKFGAIA